MILNVIIVDLVQSESSVRVCSEKFSVRLIHRNLLYIRACALEFFDFQNFELFVVNKL